MLTVVLISVYIFGIALAYLVIGFFNNVWNEKISDGWCIFSWITILSLLIIALLIEATLLLFFIFEKTNKNLKEFIEIIKEEFKEN